MNFFIICVYFAIAHSLWIDPGVLRRLNCPISTAINTKVIGSSIAATASQEMLNELYYIARPSPTLIMGH